MSVDEQIIGRFMNNAGAKKCIEPVINVKVMTLRMMISLTF